MRLLARVQAAAAAGGEPLVDLGRGNPDVPPPQHVIDALAESANEQTPRVHGYAPFAGLPELRRAIASRYAEHYGVELDPDHEVAVVPGTKSALVELVLLTAQRGDTVLLPDPYYPDYPSGIALAGADLGLLQLDPERGYAPRFDLAPRERHRARLPQLPVEPDRGGRQGRDVRGRCRVRAGDRRGDRARLRVRRSRLRRAHAAELPRRARRARGRGRAVLDVEELRDGRLARRLRARQRGARRADDDAAGSRPRGHLHAGAAGVDRGADRAAGDRCRADTALRAQARPRPRSGRRVGRALRGDVLRLASPSRRPDAGTVARRGPPRRRAGRGLRPVGPGLGAALARDARRACWTSVSSASPPHSPVDLARKQTRIELFQSGAETNAGFDGIVFKAGA